MCRVVDVPCCDAEVFAAAYIGFANGGVVHTDALASTGPRPVYFARFWQWSIAVPILIVISNRSFFTNLTLSEMTLRCLPSVVASFLFCWAAWVMEATAMCLSIRRLLQGARDGEGGGIFQRRGMQTSGLLKPMGLTPGAAGGFPPAPCR